MKNTFAAASIAFAGLVGGAQSADARDPKCALSTETSGTSASNNGTRYDIHEVSPDGRSTRNAMHIQNDAVFGVTVVCEGVTHPQLQKILDSIRVTVQDESGAVHDVAANKVSRTAAHDGMGVVTVKVNADSKKLPEKQIYKVEGDFDGGKQVQEVDLTVHPNLEDRQDKDIETAVTDAKNATSNKLKFTVEGDPRSDTGGGMAEFGFPLWRHEGDSTDLRLELQAGIGAHRQRVYALDRDHAVLADVKLALGFEAAWKLGDSFELFAEPSVGIADHISATDRIEYPDKSLDNGHALALAMGAHAGVKFNVSKQAAIVLGGGVNFEYGQSAVKEPSEPAHFTTVPTIDIGVDIGY